MKSGAISDKKTYQELSLTKPSKNVDFHFLENNQCTFYAYLVMKYCDFLNRKLVLPLLCTYEKTEEEFQLIWKRWNWKRSKGGV